MLLWSVVLAVAQGLLETSTLAKGLTWPLLARHRNVVSLRRKVISLPLKFSTSFRTAPILFPTVDQGRQRLYGGVRSVDPCSLNCQQKTLDNVHPDNAIAQNTPCHWSRLPLNAAHTLAVASSLMGDLTSSSLRLCHSNFRAVL